MHQAISKADANSRRYLSWCMFRGRVVEVVGSELGLPNASVIVNGWGGSASLRGPKIQIATCSGLAPDRRKSDNSMDLLCLDVSSVFFKAH